MLFKIELLRTWYGLSDSEVEDQVNDRLSFTRFVRISMDSVSPDSTTICRFRNMLSAANVYERLLDEINRQLKEKRVIVLKGAIVDASVTESPRRPRGKKEYVVVEDRHEEEGAAEAEEAFLKEKEKPNVDKEARWVKKAGKLRFGYKRFSPFPPAFLSSLLNRYTQSQVFDTEVLSASPFGGLCRDLIY